MSLPPVADQAVVLLTAYEHVGPWIIVENKGPGSSQRVKRILIPRSICDEHAVPDVRAYAQTSEVGKRSMRAVLPFVDRGDDAPGRHIVRPVGKAGSVDDEFPVRGRIDDRKLGRRRYAVGLDDVGGPHLLKGVIGLEVHPGRRQNGDRCHRGFDGHRRRGRYPVGHRHREAGGCRGAGMDEDHMAILELLLGELEDARLRRIIEGDVAIGRACDIERQLVRRYYRDRPHAERRS